MIKWKILSPVMNAVNDKYDYLLVDSEVPNENLIRNVIILDIPIIRIIHLENI
jgi:hypothetical protein